MKTSVEYVYTRRGQLAGKYLGGKLKPDAAVEYEYAKDGQIVARTANGVRQTYEYDFKGQLLGVKEGEEYVERYAYDRAGNMTKKTVGGKTTTFTFDDANQLVSSTTDGITTRYEYDAAGRLVREGNKTYTYGYLDKVMSVRDGANTYTYTYHPDGQLATADYGKDGNEVFTWDGLALIQRGDEHFLNEPHVGGGNPIASSKGTSYFNDMLGTTVGAKKGSKYSAATLSAFGEDLTHHCPPPPTFSTSSSFFTGKPHVAGLGHAFLMRNYRAGLGKWQTADPMGYPDGWNAMAYCGNGVTGSVDLWGCTKQYYRRELESAVISDKSISGWMFGVDDVGVPCMYQWWMKEEKITFEWYGDKAEDGNLWKDLTAGEATIIGFGVGIIGAVTKAAALTIGGVAVGTIGMGVLVWEIVTGSYGEKVKDIVYLDTYTEIKTTTYRKFIYE